MRDLIMRCDRCGDEVTVEDCSVVTLVVGRVAPANPTQVQAYIPAHQPQYKVKCSMDLCKPCIEATGWVEWVEADEPKKSIGDMFEDLIYDSVQEAQEG